MLHFTKKRALVAGIVASLALAAGAYAYFSSTGTGSGSASVGSSSAFTIAVSTDATGTLYPGAGSEVLTYTVTNPSAGHQNLASTAAVVASDINGDILQGATPVAGCKASWFTATAASTNPLPQNLAGGGTSSGTVTVTMQDSGTNQDPCQNKTPKITVNAA